MSNFDKWEDIRKGFNFTQEEEIEIALEKQIIEATIKARKDENVTQKSLSEMSGVKQSAIARLENGKNIPNVLTLLKLLLPIGYTLKVVPINKENKK